MELDYSAEAGAPEPADEARLLHSLLQPGSSLGEPHARYRRALARRGLLALLESPEAAPLPPAERVCLSAVAEVARRYQPQAPRLAGVITGPRQALAHLSDLREAPREVLVSLLLDVRGRLIRREVVAIGGLNTAAVDARDVFGPALRERAAALVLAHNHPSGDASASPTDVESTRRLGQAGRLLGVELLDHLVVVRSGYLSLREAGLM
ncbi:MAG: JAB domain-containing protein [Candidatus Dormibacteria bacterium]